MPSEEFEAFRERARKQVHAASEATGAKFDADATEEHTDDRGLLRLPPGSVVEGLVVNVDTFAGDFGDTPVITIADEQRGKALRMFFSGTMLAERAPEFVLGAWGFVRFEGKQLKKGIAEAAAKPTDYYAKYFAKAVAPERFPVEPTQEAPTDPVDPYADEEGF